mmetsp:Transcript_9753/g.23840  ORF Transcript_9753/g.23840 Transcript_9753/m.23840 type:complete len:82 (+) Transcript_9753:1706-1951(+)
MLSKNDPSACLISTENLNNLHSDLGSCLSANLVMNTQILMVTGMKHCFKNHKVRIVNLSTRSPYSTVNALIFLQLLTSALK